MSITDERDITTLQIDVWTDFACPFCYLAKPRLDAAIAATGRADEITLHYRAWELFPEATSEPFDSLEHVAHAYGGEQRALAMEDRLGGLAASQGQPYRPHHPVASSVDAHRVLKLATEHGQADPFIVGLQRDLFGEGTDVYHRDYLVPLAVSLGIPADRVATVLDGDEFLDQVRADQAEGQRLGLTGVPFTVLGGSRAIAGAVAVEDFRRAIEAALDARPGTGEGSAE